MRLQELHINNFKFFSEVEANSPLLKIDGKNLLIYGENGSGKSTIYWALYTLLECSIKTNDEGIRKYFKKTGNESLVNIYANTGRSDAYVKAVLKDQTSGLLKSYAVSRRTGGLRIRNSTSAQESNMASDFLNYRILLGLHNLKNSVNNDLFKWFEEEVLQYVKIGTEVSLGIYRKLISGPEKYSNINGDEVFPIASLRTNINPAERLRYRDYQAYKQKVEEWNSWFKSFLENIVLRANKLIKDDFEFNFQFNFIFSKLSFRITEDDFEAISPVISFKITEYNGITNPHIQKPHTFLNEAKWSAIGLAIRLSILDIKLYTADLKCLVLDDMLLSLDMSNRDIVLNILLDKYANDYQLILLTHDRSFYEFAKRKIDLRGKAKNWMCLEMFEDLLSTKPKPYFKPLKTNLQTALDYFNQHDYPACGIYLRREIEKNLVDLMPNFYKLEFSNQETKYIDKRLNDLINSFPLYCILENIDFDDFKELKTYKDALLNPLAHNDLEAPFYKKELEVLMKILVKLEKTKRTRIVHNNNRRMNFTLTKPDATFFRVFMRSKENVFLIEEEGKQPRISIFTKCVVAGTSNNGTEIRLEENFDSLKDVYIEMCNRFGIAPLQDLSRVFDYNGETFDQRLAILDN